MAERDGTTMVLRSAHVHECELAGGRVDTEEMPEANSKELWQRGIDWPVVVWIALVHVLALVAPFYFSWQASGGLRGADLAHRLGAACAWVTIAA